MRRKIWLILLCLSLVLPLSGCGKIVSREDYDKLASELADAKAKIASQQKDMLKEQQATIKMLAYVAFLDLLMYPYFVQHDLPTRFEFESVQAWADKLKGGAALINDEKLIDYVNKIEKGEVGLSEVANYVIGKIVELASS